MTSGSEACSLAFANIRYGLWRLSDAIRAIGAANERLSEELERHS